MCNLKPLTSQTRHQAIHIAEDDMIHITWRHVTLRINVTGFIYLIDFLNGDERRAIGFEVYGTPDDGYQIWVQNVGLRLTYEECCQFKQMLIQGLRCLQEMGKHGDTHHLPDWLKLTTPTTSVTNTHLPN